MIAVSCVGYVSTIQFSYIILVLKLTVPRFYNGLCRVRRRLQWVEFDWVQTLWAGFKKTDPCPTLVTIPASVVLGQTMSALVGYQKLGSAGAPALVAGEWRTPLKHTPPRMLSH